MSTRKTERRIADDNSSQALRQRAEEKACLDESSVLESLTLDDARRMLHNMQVLQIELEMQNDDLRSTQHELEVSRARFFNLYDLTPIGYLTISEQGLILEANFAASAMFGMSRICLHKMPISSFILREYWDIYNLHRDKVADAGELQDWEMRMMRADGSPFWANLQSFPALNGEYCLIVNDITEHKRVEIQLHKKNSEIEQFIYTVSHDLRSPLVTIKTFLGYLVQDISTSDSKRIDKDMEYIHAAANRVEALLNELLDMSRVGRTTILKEPVTFQELVAEALDAVAGQISAGKVDVRVSADNPTLFGDRRRLLQIWQNLLDNALKYMGDQTAPSIEIGIERQDGETVFIICDNGIGIDPVYHEKIFGIFEKLDLKIGGVGMGLTMVRRIVEAYGGNIRVESEGNGTGSCFRFTLPEAVKGREGK